jgi:hypothetical protein
MPIMSPNAVAELLAKAEREWIAAVARGDLAGAIACEAELVRLGDLAIGR